MANAPDQSRHPKTGKYLRSVATALRDTQACELRAKGYTYQQIADELGYADKGEAHHAVDRALKATMKEPTEAVRALELERLDAELQRLNEYEAAARDVLARQHVTVSHGRVIKNDSGDSGEPILDDGPVLQAIDRLVRIEDARRRNGERRAKLLGLDMPVKVDAQVTEVTQQDLEIQELIREAKAKVAAQEAQIKDGGA